MIPLDIPSTVLLVIGASALVTYLLRIGGLLLAARLPRTGGFKTFMETLPGTILIALIAPGIFSEGVWSAAAVVCTAFCAWKTRNVFLAMLIGMAIVAVHRQFFL